MFVSNTGFRFFCFELDFGVLLLLLCVEKLKKTAKKRTGKKSMDQVHDEDVNTYVLKVVWFKCGCVDLVLSGTNNKPQIKSRDTIYQHH